MTGSDIAFLAIFIILPTAVLVSGIWLITILIMRRREQTNAPLIEGPTVPVGLEVENEQADAAAEPISEVPQTGFALAEPLPAVEPQIALMDPISTEPEPIEVVSPMTADLLNQQSESEPNTGTLRIDAVENAQTEHEETPSDTRMRTEEIPEIDDVAFEPARLVRKADDDEVETHAGEHPEHSTNDPEAEAVGIEPPGEMLDQRQEPDDGSQHIADPDRMEPEPDRDDNALENTNQEIDDEEDQTAPSRRRKRRPGRRLIPGDHASERDSRRGRHSGRRVPRLFRSRDDEHGM